MHIILMSLSVFSPLAVTIMAMKEPVCLIESDSDGRLVVVPSALKILQQIEQKVVVVSVVGMCRTGKSYLMNKLAGTNKGEHFHYKMDIAYSC